MNRRFFEDLMAQRQISLRSLAKEMGMKHSQLSLTFSGARRLQLDEAVKLSEIFGVPLHTIAQNAGAMSGFAGGDRINVTGAMRGSGIVEGLPPGVVERVAVPASFVGRDSVAVQARTADTPMSWLDGVVWVCRPMVAVEEGVGRLCWLTLDDGREVMAVPRRGYLPGTYNLSGPFQAEDVAVTSGRVVQLTIH